MGGREKARELLRRRYEGLARETGHVDIAEFYPVDAERLIPGGWTLERVDAVGFTSYCENIRAQCLAKERKIRIATSQVSSDGAQNFTIAHEIGHVLLHFGEGNKTPVPAGKMTGPEERWRRLEREANIFAAELLMPEKAVRWKFRSVFGFERLWTRSAMVRGAVANARLEGEPDPLRRAALAIAGLKRTVGERKSLADFFLVSRTAMALRLSELGLLYF